jgi:hypothetical protein
VISSDGDPDLKASAPTAPFVKKKKLPKREQPSHRRQKRRERRRLQKKRWRERQQKLRLGLNQQWMHQHKTQKKKKEKHNQPPAQQPPPSALAMTPATTPAAAESEPATTVAATPSNNINNHKGSKTNFLTKIMKSGKLIKKQITQKTTQAAKILKPLSRLPRPIWTLWNRTTLDTASPDQCFGSPPSPECSNGTEDDVERTTEEQVLTRVVAVS